MKFTVAHVLLTGLLVAGALALGWGLGNRSKSAENARVGAATSRLETESGEASVTQLRLTDQDRRELAQLVRREVIAAQQVPGASVKSAELLPSQEPDAARREEMFTAALSTVSSARDVGMWTHEDGVVLQQVGASLTPEQRRKVSKEFLQALNSQKLTIEQGAFIP